MSYSHLLVPHHGKAPQDIFTWKIIEHRYQRSQQLSESESLDSEKKVSEDDDSGWKNETKGVKRETEYSKVS